VKSANKRISGIKIYIEGGGDGPVGKQLLRQGFDALLDKQKQAARHRKLRWNLVLGGGRNATFDSFRQAAASSREEIVALLVDSEAAVANATPAGRIDHLSKRKGDEWEMGWADPERVHLMTQCMEAWIVADPEKVEEFYGKDFSPTLPKRQKLDEEPKLSLYKALEAASKKTQKGTYGKIHHASALLSKVRPDRVSARCESFRLFTSWLDGVIRAA
jgi:Domain of unknown function (DUF4276)